MAGILIDGVSKVFGGAVKAVDDLHLQVGDGEFLVIVGPSGCGKTTALRMVAGLEEITSGSISIGDRVVNELPAKDRDIAMVFQNYALYPHMTVYENIAFSVRLRDAGGFWWELTHLRKATDSRRMVDQRVVEAATMLGIEGLLDRHPSELSGGQRQRVALARAIVRKPQVFLMDEPLSNLDAKLRVQTRSELVRLHRRLQVTTLYVTHDQVEAMSMGQRIAIMRDGVLQQCDKPTDVYAHPVNRFVAGFIGSPPMNFFDGVVQDGVCEALGLQVALKRHEAGTKLQQGKVTVGVRPEAIRPAGKGNTAVKFEGLVELVEHLGNSKLAYLTVGGARIMASLPPDANLEEKQAAPFEIDYSDVHFFDVSTELAIVSE